MFFLHLISFASLELVVITQSSKIVVKIIFLLIFQLYWILNDCYKYFFFNVSLSTSHDTMKIFRGMSLKKKIATILIQILQVTEINIQHLTLFLMAFKYWQLLSMESRGYRYHKCHYNL